MYAQFLKLGGKYFCGAVAIIGTVGSESPNQKASECSKGVNSEPKPLTYNDYFMGMAKLASLRAEDPCRQVGTVIVAKDKKLVGVGHNGMPQGTDYSKPNMHWNSGEWCPESGEKEWLESKYPYVCHAQMNAIDLYIQGDNMKGCTMYTTLAPSNETSKSIIQVGIERVVYLSKEYDIKGPHGSVKKAKEFLGKAGVWLNKYLPDRKEPEPVILRLTPQNNSSEDSLPSPSPPLCLKNFLGKAGVWLNKYLPDRKEYNPRKDILPLSDYFMAVAVLSKERSKDPNRKVGAAISDKNNKLIAVGWNGMPLGEDKIYSWDKKIKNDYVCHAERNALHLYCQAGAMEGCTLYTTLFPCNECAKSIIQFGIKKVVYLDDKPTKPASIAGRKLLKVAGIELVPFKTTVKDGQVKL